MGAIQAMTPRLKADFSCHAAKFLVALFIGLSLATAPVALAKYIPPKKPSAPKNTSTTITRGESCTPDAEGQLVALVPSSHVGVTISRRPTFAWYVPDRESYPIEFRLFRLNGQRLYKTQTQSQPGVMQFSLPEDQPELAPGHYIWQVVLQCDRSSPIIVSAAIQVVEPTAELEQQLAAEPDAQKHANLYAESGLWFDALAAALNNIGDPENQPVLLDLFNFLAATDAQLLKQWSDRLLQPEVVQTPHIPH